MMLVFKHLTIIYEMESIDKSFSYSRTVNNRIYLTQKY